jgi:hypothetical protein
LHVIEILFRTQIRHLAPDSLDRGLASPGPGRGRASRGISLATSECNKSGRESAVARIGEDLVSPDLMNVVRVTRANVTPCQVRRGCATSFVGPVVFFLDMGRTDA